MSSRPSILGTVTNHTEYRTGHDDDAWKQQGLCMQVDPDLWFPEKGQHKPAAKRICNTPCPVKEACLEYALAIDSPKSATRERQEARAICAACPLLPPCAALAIATPVGLYDGIWAGMSRNQRERARAKQPRKAS